MSSGGLRAVLVVGLVALLFATSGCASREDRIAGHLTEGQRLLAESNLDKARIEFRNALQLDPENVEARFLSGRVMEGLGNYREAVGLYQAAIDSDPSYVPARANLGRIYVFAGAPDLALDTIAPVLDDNPDNVELLNVRGAARIQQGDAEGARADAARALALEPANENALGLMASLLEQAGEREQAIALVERGVEANPASIDLLRILATLYTAADRTADVEPLLARLVELQPTVFGHRFQLALFHLRAGRLDPAQAVLREAVLAVDDDTARQALVEFLASQRSREMGEQVMRELMALRPRDRELPIALATLQQRHGAADDAMATLSEVVRSDRRGLAGFKARKRMAAIELQRGNAAEAGRLVEEVLNERPRDSEALVLRGQMALAAGDSAAAIADLRAVLRDQPDAVPVQRALAQAHVAREERALAEDTLRAALASAPGNAALRVDLARLLLDTGRASAALVLLEEAVKVAPQDIPARWALTQAYLASGRLDEARRSVEDLRLIAPADASVPYLAGLIASAQSRAVDAELELARALELQPNAIDALSAWSRLLVAEGRLDEARSRVAALVEAEPDNAAALNLLGEIHLAGGDSVRALADFQRAATLAPGWWLVHRNIALTHLARDQKAAAIAAYETGLAQTDMDPNLTVGLAAMQEREGRPDAAIELYERLVQRRPDSELAANNLAMLLVTYRQDAASLDRARDLAAGFADRDDPALLDTLGWVHFKRGEIALALPLLERAVEAAPEARVLRYHLAMAQLEAGQRDQARANLERALQGSPTFTGVPEGRAALERLREGRS